MAKNRLRPLHIYFIRTMLMRNENDKFTVDMNESYRIANNFSLNTEWIDEDECRNINNQEKGKILVFPIFEGVIFDEIKETHRNRLIGPRCLLACLLNVVPIPITRFPVYYLAMNNMVISFSNMSNKDMEHSENMIHYMAGNVQRKFDSSTTHLIVNEAGSDDYFKAVIKNIPILKNTWIKDVWKRNLIKDISAADRNIIQEHSCPIFYNLLISASNISEQTKRHLEKKINENGGRFTRDMTKNHNILIIPNAEETTKFKYARNWRIKCLNVDWVDTCIQKGRIVRFKNYLIRDIVSSTRIYSNNIEMTSFVDTNLTGIPQQNATEAVISDTQSQNMEYHTSTNHSTNVECKTPVKMSCSLSETFEDDEYKKLLISVKKCGSILDGCKIFLIGFNSVEEEKLKKVLNFAGSIRYTELTDSITHVVVGNFNKTDEEFISKIPFKPHIVSINWLLDSIKNKRLENETNYFYAIGSDKVPEPILSKEYQPSPLSKKSAQILDPSINEPQIDTKALIAEERNWVNGNPDLPINEKCDEKNEKSISKSIYTGSSDAITPIHGLFSGLKFNIVGHSTTIADHIKKVILQCNGVVKRNGIIDYTVVPIITNNKIFDKNEIVTPIWMQDCIDENKIVDIKYYHRPIFSETKARLLENCVITFSSYEEGERNYLQVLATWLGARCQEALARRDRTDKKAYKTTHLVCSIDGGSKVKAAKNWNLPVVKEGWLIKCFEKQQYIPADEFLLFPTVSPEYASTYPSVSASSSNTTNVPYIIPAEGEASDISKHMDKNIEFAVPSTSNKSLDIVPEIKPVSKLNPKHSEENISIKRLCDATPTLNCAINDTTLQSNSRINPLIAIGGPSKLSHVPPTGLLTKIYNSANKRKNLNISSESEISKYESPKYKSMKLNSDTPLSQEVGWKDTLNDINLLNKFHRNDSSSSSLSPTVIINPNQLDSSGNLQPTHRNDQPVVENEVPLGSRSHNFMISVKSEFKQVFEDVITSLGGQIVSNIQVDCTKTNNATHLVIDELNKTERLLCSIASGLWILHSSYVEACQNAHKFLNEEEFEWGNPISHNIPLKQGKKDFTSVANAAYKWRKIIQEGGPSKLPFVDMKVTFIGGPSDDKMIQSLTKIVYSGGGTVLPVSEIFKSTHCILKHAKDINEINGHLKVLANNRIHVLLAIYLSDYLVYDPPPKPEDAYLPEYSRYLMKSR